MSGIQEILVVLVVILILFYLPQRTGGNRTQKTGGLSGALSGKVRLALLISFVWLACTAYFLPPWEERIFPFLYLGIGPIVLGWGISWVFFGFRKHS